MLLGALFFKSLDMFRNEGPLYEWLKNSVVRQLKHLGRNRLQTL